MRTGARPRRLQALWVVLVGMGLAAAVLGWSWLRGALVAPLTMTVWLLLRVLVLPVHQAVWWVALVCAAPVLLGVALYRRRRPLDAPPPPARDRDPDPVERWRWTVEESAAGGAPLATIGWSAFVQLVVSLRALERRVPPDYRLHDALRAGLVPLPPEVHAFLFPPPPARPRSLGARLRRWAGAPGRAARRLSGRERADHLRSVSHVLSFLERSLEMTHEHPDDPAHR